MSDVGREGKKITLLDYCCKSRKVERPEVGTDLSLYLTTCLSDGRRGRRRSLTENGEQSVVFLVNLSK